MNLTREQEEGLKQVDRMPAMLQSQTDEWILDTGTSGHVVNSALKEVTSSETEAVQSAGGMTASKGTGVAATPLGDLAESRLLPDSPNLFCLGELCHQRLQIR